MTDVAGNSIMQNMRAHRFHVNFPIRLLYGVFVQRRQR